MILIKKQEIYEEMFGSADKTINESQLNEYLTRLERTKGYPKEWYPPSTEFILQAKDRAYPAPKDIFNELTR